MVVTEELLLDYLVAPHLLLVVAVVEAVTLVVLQPDLAVVLQVLIQTQMDMMVVLDLHKVVMDLLL
jgi:hypothetical protein|tara:strand:+ start:330 stop:527 length:198 start_codon:yes stop_codon:yes gene_type:complete